MRRIFTATALAAACLSGALAFPALAQTAGADEGCAGYATWAAPVAVKSSPADYDLPVARLTLGQAAMASLHPVDAVAFIAEPERFPDPDVFAGLLGFDAPVAGTYRISLGEGAWVDVVNGDELVPSVGFGHGPGCDGLRKVVEFALQPGAYVVQISGNPQPEIVVMASRVN